MMQSISLSKLICSRHNPRRVKPAMEAHRQMVASVRAFGLLEPLVVRPAEDKRGFYEVIAGGRRLAALNEVHRGSKKDPKIDCEVREVEDSAAAALSLSENFVRAPMHPLDEAQAFAAMAGEEGKHAEQIAEQFGVTAKYVRQRMKLATLAKPIQVAYRQDEIDTGTAEAFAGVPEDRQLAVWQEMNGHPRHAEHVRNVIANQWIDAEHAIFEIGSLPESAVSRDLFSDRMLIERQAFMTAQTAALETERAALMEDGWSSATVCPRTDVQDRLYAMDAAEPEYDAATQRKLSKIDQQWEAVEAKIDKLPEGDEAAYRKHQQKLQTLETLAEKLKAKAPMQFAESTKAVGTAFLILDPDGRVHREYRVPRPRGRQASGPNGSGVAADGKPKPRTSEDLSDGQLSTTFMHQTLAVRAALLDDPKARRRMLALLLHEKVRSEALAIRHEVNGVTLQACNADAFASPAWDRLRKSRAKLDPLVEKTLVEDTDAYDELGKLPNGKLDALIDLLMVESLTSHPLRRTELIARLAAELGVNVRQVWRPDAAWLSGYQKIQLAHLLAELSIPGYSVEHEQRKKSELVTSLAQLFADAADGKLQDKTLAERANRWLPSNLRAAEAKAREA